MIRTKPASDDYRNNFDAIFKKEPMKRYRVPVDVFIYAESAEAVEKKANKFMENAARDWGPTYNLGGYTFPVDYPTEEEPIGESIRT